jgi:hypothetical protein
VPEGLHHLADLVGHARIGAALLQRPDIGRGGLAGVLDELRHVARQFVEVRHRRRLCGFDLQSVHLVGPPPAVATLAPSPCDGSNQCLPLLVCPLFGILTVEKAWFPDHS